MAIIHLCDREAGCTFEVWDRTVSLTEWVDNSARLVADPEWPVGKRHLTDLRTIDDISSIFESDLNEVSSLFSIYSERVNGLRLAIVLAHKGQRRPRLFAQFVSSIGVNSFVSDNVEAACSWLGIEPDGAQRTLSDLRAMIRRGPVK